MNRYLSALIYFGIAGLSCSGLIACKETIPGLNNLSVGVTNNELTASFVATAMKDGFSASSPIPQLDNATFSIMPSISAGKIQGTVFSFSIPLGAITGGTGVLAGLPDGAALPDVSGGELPRSSFTMGSETIYVYLGDQAFGMFIPVPLEAASGALLGTTISYSIDDANGNQVGKIYAIAPTTGTNSGGVFLLIPLT